MVKLKAIAPEAVASALEKAKRYRLLNEPDEAESICLDILAVVPDHQEALILRLLALTDKFVDEGLKAYLGTTEFERSDGVVIDAPEVAENGSTVPVTVESSLPDVRSITLYVEENGAPMTSIYEFGPRGQPYVSQRIRMADTSKVVAVADSGGKLYWNSRKVRVTIGGCGG